MSSELSVFMSDISDRRSRRSVLRSGVGLLGAALGAPGGATLGAQPPRTGNVGRIGSLLNQLPQQAHWRSPELRLVRRVTMGLNQADVERVLSIGYDAYLEEQLNPSRMDDSVAEARIQVPYIQRMLALSTRELRALDDAGNAYFESQLPMALLTTERAVFSRRQLQERMFEFFCDHLYVPVWSAWNMAIHHYEQVVRPHVLGSFGELTRAGMRSPAMLMYLDQVWSTRWGINENYARELMELHTVGWDGGYTQQDVVALARVLTGWGINTNSEFHYNANHHDFGAKQAFGLTFPARPQATSGTAGMDEGIAFGEMLIRHPNTKRFLATKLLRWFVRPNPTERQIAEVMAAYGDQGDIKAMLRVVLSRQNLAQAPAKLKRPFHYGMSILRATQASILPVTDLRRNNLILVSPLWSLRQPYMSWPTPDGYPDRADFWAGLIVDRWTQVQWNYIPDNPGPGGAQIDLARFRGDGTTEGAVQEISRRMFGGEMSAGLANELRLLLRSGVTDTRLRTALRLAVSAPEFQFY